MKNFTLALLAAVGFIGNICAAESSVKTVANSKETQGGSNGSEFWLYEPTAVPAGEKPSLIIFLHGWAAIDPWVYSAWIDHLVKQGNVVIYPRYQSNVLTPPSNFLPNAIKAVKEALAVLETDGHVKPDLQRCAIVGHSAGGLLTSLMAASSKDQGLPTPKAICCVQPGKSSGKGRSLGISLNNLDQIPISTLLLCVTGDQDNVCGDKDALAIMNLTTQIPAERKSHVVQLTSDSLSASHYAPCSILPDPIDDSIKSGIINEVKAMSSAISGNFGPVRDFLKTSKGQKWMQDIGSKASFMESLAQPNELDHGLWQMFDHLTTAAFTGKELDAAMGRTEKAKALGAWNPERK